MKRGTPDHPKMLDLAEQVHGFLDSQGNSLPFEICHTLACGVIERLFHYTARYAPAGDIGKHSDLRISRGAGWSFDALWLVRALVHSRWLDVTEDDSRLYVHDWHDHSDDAADKWLHDKGLTYANGAATRRGRGVSRDKSRRGRDKSRPSRDLSSQSEPSSEPSSESVSKPEAAAAFAARVEIPSELKTQAVETALRDWISYKAKRGEAYKDPSFVARKLAEFVPAGPGAFVAAVNSSIGSNYAGLFPSKAIDPKKKPAAIRPTSPVPARIPKADFTRDPYAEQQPSDAG